MALSFSLNLLTAAIALLTILVSYVSGLLIYRLTLHPLSSYPGPVLAKLTSWYEVYYAMKGTRYLEHWRCHELYGDYVRIAPNTLSINTASGLRDIYGPRGNVRKADWYNTLTSYPGAYSTHNCIPKDVHAKKRRILSHAFSEEAMRSMEPTMIGVVRAWLKALASLEKSAEKDELSSKAVSKDMSAWTNYLSLDILGKLCFGESFETTTKTDNRWVMSAMMHTIIVRNPRGFKQSVYTFYPFRRLLFGNIEPLEKNAYIMYARGAVEKRMKKDPEQCDKDFISWLLEARDPETGMCFELKELWAESSLLIAAGSDTSSTAMSALLFYLARYPACLSKLSAELQTTFKDVEEIRSGVALTSCRYLRACIDEALRMAPPIPGLLLRTVMEGGMTIDGKYIPEGVNVGVGAYSVMHKPIFFPEPFAFKPERWLAEEDGEHSAANVELAKSAFCPFSIGSRGCIGKSMAYLELSIAMARLVYMYHFRAIDGDDSGAGKPGLEYGRHRRDEFQLVDNFICAKTGPQLVFERVAKTVASQ